MTDTVRRGAFDAESWRIFEIYEKEQRHYARGIGK